MGNIEILNKDRTLEEVKTFSKNVSEQSDINIKTVSSNNVFLTSLLVGASIIPPSVSSIKPIQITQSSENQITISRHYIQEVENDIIKYVNNISTISRKTITKQILIKKILSFKTLNESWDGFGSLPLEVESTYNTLQLIDLIGEHIFCTVNEFYPNPNGTITFEWTNSENEIVSVDIGNKTFSYFVELSSMNPRFFNNKKINVEEVKMLTEFIKSV